MRFRRWVKVNAANSRTSSAGKDGPTNGISGTRPSLTNAWKRHVKGRLTKCFDMIQRTAPIDTAQLVKIPPVNAPTTHVDTTPLEQNPPAVTSIPHEATSTVTQTQLRASKPRRPTLPEKGSRATSPIKKPEPQPTVVVKPAKKEF